MLVRRVVTVTVPPLFADILREVLAGQLAIEIVVQIGRRSRLEQRLRAERPDFILIGLRRGETRQPRCDGRVRKHPPDKRAGGRRNGVCLPPQWDPAARDRGPSAPSSLTRKRSRPNEFRERTVQIASPTSPFSISTREAEKRSFAAVRESRTIKECRRAS